MLCIPCEFVSCLRLATEQHCTVPQKGGKWEGWFSNSRAQDPHSGRSRRGTAQGGQGVWWVGFLTISNYIYNI